LSTIFTEIVDRQHSALERAQAIHESFLEIALAGGGLDAVADRLAALLGDAIVVVADQFGRVQAPRLTDAHARRLTHAGLLDASGRLGVDATATPRRSDGPGLDYAVAPIRSGMLYHGTVLVAADTGQLDSVAVLAAEQAALAAALDRTHQMAVAAVARQFELSILHDILTGRSTDATDVLIKDASLDWDFDREQVVIVGSIESGGRARQQQFLAAVAAEARGEDAHAAIGAYAHECVVVIGVPAGRSGNDVAQALSRRLLRLSIGEVSFGASRPVHRRNEVARGYEQARTALRVGARAGKGRAVTGFDDLGLYRLLSLVEDPVEIRLFVEDTLRGVLDLEPKERDDLLATLEALIETNMNVAAAARKLHFHYNTLRYRIAKLEGLLGPFTHDSELALQLAGALLAFRMPSNGPEWRMLSKP